MASAREDFVRRLRALKRVVDDNQTLQLLQHSLGDPEINERARLLRNGLAVSSFAILEDFLKTRAAEVLGRLSASPLAFSQLPDDLQRLCTEDVVTALRFQVDLRSRSREDAGPFIRQVATSLASTDQYPYTLSGIAFGHARSNLVHGDVKDLLKAFNIADGWGNVTGFARRMGLGSFALRDDFVQAAQRRHRGAHEASAETPLGDLRSYPAQALGIAAGFDALLSRAAYLLIRGDQVFARGKPELVEGEIGIRFIEQEGTIYRDIREGAARAAQRSDDKTAVLAAARGRAVRNGAVLVLRERGLPREWITTDLGSGRP